MRDRRARVAWRATRRGAGVPRRARCQCSKPNCAGARGGCGGEECCPAGPGSGGGAGGLGGAAGGAAAGGAAAAGGGGGLAAGSDAAGCGGAGGPTSLGAGDGGGCAGDAVSAAGRRSGRRSAPCVNGAGPDRSRLRPPRPPPPVAASAASRTRVVRALRAGRSAGCGIDAFGAGREADVGRKRRRLGGRQQPRPEREREACKDGARRQPGDVPPSNPCPVHQPPTSPAPSPLPPGTAPVGVQAGGPNLDRYSRPPLWPTATAERR